MENFNLPKAIALYWEKHRIWDRWIVEENEINNRATHIEQREMTINAVRHRPGLIKVIDICCGTGKIANDLINLDNVIEVLAVDINKEALNILLQNVNENKNKWKLKTIRADILNEDLSQFFGEYDIAICIDALHHLSNFTEAVYKISQFVRPKGIFIANYLNTERIRSHVIAKKGKLIFYKEYIVANLFILFKFIKLFWEFAGKKGYVRIVWLSIDKVQFVIKKYFIITESKINDYLWITSIKL